MGTHLRPPGSDPSRAGAWEGRRAAVTVVVVGRAPVQRRLAVGRGVGQVATSLRLRAPRSTRAVAAAPPDPETLARRSARAHRGHAGSWVAPSEAMQPNETGAPRAREGIAQGLEDELVRLVRAELATVRRDVAEDADELRAIAWKMAMAAGATVLGVELVLGAFIAAGRRHPFALAMLGFGLMGAGLTLGREARRAVPPALIRTRWRVADDARRLEERLQ